MPTEWVVKLYKASCEGVDAKIFDFLNQIPLENLDLAIGLTALAINLQFKVIKRLIKIDENESREDGC